MNLISALLKSETANTLIWESGSSSNPINEVFTTFPLNPFFSLKRNNNWC